MHLQLNAWAWPSPGACRQRWLHRSRLHVRTPGRFRDRLARPGSLPGDRDRLRMESLVPWPCSVPVKPRLSGALGRSSSGQPGHWEGWVWRPHPLFLGSLLWAHRLPAGSCPSLHEAACAAPVCPALLVQLVHCASCSGTVWRDGLWLRTCGPGRFTEEMLDWGCSRVKLILLTHDRPVIERQVVGAEVMILS